MLRQPTGPAHSPAGAWSIEVSPPMGAPPLTAEEHAEAEQVARRLHSELRAVIDLLPDGRRAASAMSRALRLDRATCQRIVGVAARLEVGPDGLVQLPGVQGLRQFLRAVASRKEARAQAEQLAAAGAAVDRFEELIERLGGSQRRLRSRLGLGGGHGLHAPTPGGADDPATREILFRAAAGVTGRWSQATIEARIIRPVPGQPLLTEGVRIRALIGHMARPDAVPLEVGETAPLRTGAPPTPAFETLDARPASGHTPGSLLPEFCTEPLPRVTSRAAGNRVVHVIDTAESPQTPADIVMAHRSSQPDRHPATLRPPLGEAQFLMTFPSQRMIYDVLLHRDIARRCIPSVEVHLWRPDMGAPGPGRWSTRFPGGPRLELLGPGVAAAPTAAYGRHAELVSHVLGQIGWDPAEFVGYRCETEFPIWRAAYCLIFDFTGNELEEPPAR